MLLCVLPLICLSASAQTSVAPHETQQLSEQYDENAQRCQDLACADEELDGLDSSLLLLLGRRAAVVRQRSRIAAQARSKGRPLKVPRQAVRLNWLAQKGQELGVPSALSEPIIRALVQAAEAYERQYAPQTGHRP